MHNENVLEKKNSNDLYNFFSFLQKTKGNVLVFYFLYECVFSFKPVPQSHTPVLVQVGDGSVADVTAVNSTREADGGHALIGRLQCCLQG